jgi:hypothetical protein
VSARLWWRGLFAVSVSLLAPGAHAAFLSGDALDTAADVISYIVLIFVPVALIAVFWLVHVMPEKIAEKRHHPQKEAIHTLCLLSLFFGGLLWPAAWLWAYTRPAIHKMAFGTELHDDYFYKEAELAERGEIDAARLAALRAELAAMETKAPLSPGLRALKNRLDARFGAAAETGA